MRSSPAWPRRLLIPLAPPLCCSCGSHAGSLEPLCASCRAELRWLGGEVVRLGGGVELWAPLAYDGPARGVVRELKFRGRAGLAAAMAAAVVANAPERLLHGAALVPVPLHAHRLRRRGFNQAERLAAAIAARSSLPVNDCLERVGSRSTQMGRARPERLLAMSGSVRVRRGATAPAAAVLVDDVATTGATLAACAAALRAAGAGSVRALAYARTPGR